MCSNAPNGAALHALGAFSMHLMHFPREWGGWYATPATKSRRGGCSDFDAIYKGKIRRQLSALAVLSIAR